MVSKIIQLEKDRQEIYLNHFTDCKDSRIYSKTMPIEKQAIDEAKHMIDVHKQSLINLKEYMGDLGCLIDIDTTCSHCKETLINLQLQAEQKQKDIEELNKMIDKYG